jgi:hypothetical protein
VFSFARLECRSLRLIAARLPPETPVQGAMPNSFRHVP